MKTLATTTQSLATMKLIGFAIALVQLVDLLLHTATNQLELLRVTSNLVILLWLAGTAFGKVGNKFRWLAWAPTAIYLLLNLVFLALEGITNPEQGGALRVSLFVLVLLTLALSG